MKKIFSLLLSAVLASLLICSLSACGKTEECIFCGEACSQKYQSILGGYVCEDCVDEIQGE